MEAFPDSGRMINGCPGTGTTWGHGRRRADGTVEITAEDMEHYHRQGFIILRQAFTKERMAGLLSAVRRMVAKGVAQHETMDAAGGGDSQDSTVGPNLQWIDREKEFPTRTSNMLWPDKYEPEFGEWLEDVHPHLHAVIDHGGAGVRNSLFGMLSSGAGVPYEQEWHHDGESSYFKELGCPGNWDVKRSLAFSGHSVQINAPLLPNDKFLQLVPASHMRPSTTVELAASRYADELGLTPSFRWEGHPWLPNGVTVELEPGDIVYYNSQFWHHGWNPLGPYHADRWTLHCSWGDNRAPLWEGAGYQKEPMGTPGHLDRFPPLAREMAQRYQVADDSPLTADEAAMGDKLPWDPFPAPQISLSWDADVLGAAMAPWRNKL